jgi:peptidoglycan-associated lipoprotein
MQPVRSVLFIATLFAAGCGSSTPTAETARNPNPGGTGQQVASAPVQGNAGTGTNDGCDGAPVYFAYDSADLDNPSRERLGRSARCLQQRNASNVMITGMTDPRGTEEYNLALGDRRARAVAGYVESLGVDSRKIRTTSVGEEMATGGDESSWSRDRRAEVNAQ